MNRTRRLQPEAGVIGHLPLLGLGCGMGWGPDAAVLARMPTCWTGQDLVHFSKDSVPSLPFWIWY